MTLCRTEQTGAGHGLVCEKLQNSSWSATCGAARNSVMILDLCGAQLGGMSIGRMLAMLCKGSEALCPCLGMDRDIQCPGLFFVAQRQIDVGKIALAGLKCLKPLSALGSGSFLGLGGHLVEEEWEMVREFKARDLHNLRFPCSWGGL